MPLSASVDSYLAGGRWKTVWCRFTFLLARRFGSALTPINDNCIEYQEIHTFSCSQAFPRAEEIFTNYGLNAEDAKCVRDIKPQSPTTHLITEVLNNDLLSRDGRIVIKFLRQRQVSAWIYG